jgi:hypothetical protein
MYGKQIYGEDVRESAPRNRILPLRAINKPAYCRLLRESCCNQFNPQAPPAQGEYDGTSQFPDEQAPKSSKLEELLDVAKADTFFELFLEPQEGQVIISCSSRTLKKMS